MHTNTTGGPTDRPVLHRRPEDAADQPTTEPSVQAVDAAARAMQESDLASGTMTGTARWYKRYATVAVQAVAPLLAPAPQPAAERYDGTWDEPQWEAWSSDVASEMPEEWDSDEGQEAIILRFVKYATAHLATCPTEHEPAADNETEVQWGRRGQYGVVIESSREDAESLLLDSQVLVRRTMTPWEEA